MHSQVHFSPADKKMVGHKLAFYVTLKPNMIKDLKIRCDYREEFEFGGTLEVDEMKWRKNK